MNSTKMPLIFFGHGSPMNAIESNIYTDSWKAIGKSIFPKPRAILMLSAHWITKGETRINISENPEMIYDMYGFPPDLYRVQYLAPGSRAIAEEIIESLSSEYSITPDPLHGLDHGAWSILIHAFPDADIPVIQMSLDYTQLPEWHYGFGKQLRVLREQGILIIGSGNIVHNLRAIDWTDREQFPWAVEFDRRISEDIREGKYEDILDFHSWGDITRLSHPSYDHFLPIFPLLGAIDREDEVSFFTPEISMGSLAMRSVVWRYGPRRR